MKQKPRRIFRDSSPRISGLYFDRLAGRLKSKRRLSDSEATAMAIRLVDEESAKMREDQAKAARTAAVATMHRGVL
jgi:hypothetical protein